MGDLISDEDELLNAFYSNFAQVASLQGRCSYAIMSLHIVQPDFLRNFLTIDPKRFLYVNMMYGVGVMIYSRPNMRGIGFFNRFMFSILGSSMFNYSSIAIFEYIRSSMPGRMKWACAFSFLTGRFFMLHLLAYLYHVDIRSRDRNIPRNPLFDSMYLD